MISFYLYTWLFWLDIHLFTNWMYVLSEYRKEHWSHYNWSFRQFWAAMSILEIEIHCSSRTGNDLMSDISTSPYCNFEWNKCISLSFLVREIIFIREDFPLCFQLPSSQPWNHVHVYIKPVTIYRMNRLHLHSCSRKFLYYSFPQPFNSK